jgi:1-acyl-sn-glycerol-3-phosphate acyltransferase
MALVLEPLLREHAAGPPLLAARRSAALVATIGKLLAEAGTQRKAAPAALAGRAARTAATILRVHGVDVLLSGAAVPLGPHVVACNHVSYLDPLVVSAVVPCVSIAKGETARWPIIGPGLRALGVVFVRREDPHSGAVALRRAWRTLESGASVLNFPEGTTSDGRSVYAFRRGMFGVAILARVPVLPLRIVYEDDRVPWFGGATFAPHYWKLAGTERVMVRVRVGEPIEPHAGESARDLAARVRDAVVAL